MRSEYAYLTLLEVLDYIYPVGCKDSNISIEISNRSFGNQAVTFVDDLGDKYTFMVTFDSSEEGHISFGGLLYKMSSEETEYLMKKLDEKKKEIAFAILQHISRSMNRKL